jgi:hypothetical protein
MAVLDMPRLAEVALRLPVHVVDTEGDFSVCSGTTLGLGLNGVLAHLDDRLPSTCETTVQVELPDGSELVTGAVVAQGFPDGHGWTYRLVFSHLELADIDAIISLLDAS